MPRFPLPLRTGFLAALLGAGLLGCEEIGAPEEGVDESDLTFVRVSPDSPPLEDDTVSFWAVRGQDRQVEMRYLSLPEYPGNGKCLLFRVPAEALLRDRNGRVFQDGDSVKITIRVVDAERFQFQFEPSGLRFDPTHPAHLEVRYRWASPDFNHDGEVDELDELAAERIRFWHQVVIGGRWTEIPTVLAGEAIEARTTVLRFSQYALALD